MFSAWSKIWFKNGGLLKGKLIFSDKAGSPIPSCSINQLSQPRISVVTCTLYCIVYSVHCTV